MKKLQVIILLLTVCSYAYSQTGEKREYYDNGQLESIGRYDQKGEKTGGWKYYHENGQLEAVGSYFNGLRIGEWEFYYEYPLYENDQLELIGSYINGKKTGEWKAYYKNGQLKAIANYINGEETGECKEYYANGQLKEISNFIAGKQTGKWEKYSEDGKLKHSHNYNKYSEKHGECKEYYTNGQLKEIGSYTEGSKTGEWKYYYEDGQLAAGGSYIDDKMSGKWEAYHKNGKLSASGNFNDGQRTGKWEAYHENGNLKEIANYMSQKLIISDFNLQDEYGRNINIHSLLNTSDPVMIILWDLFSHCYNWVQVCADNYANWKKQTNVNIYVIKIVFVKNKTLTKESAKDIEKTKEMFAKKNWNNIEVLYDVDKEFNKSNIFNIESDGLPRTYIFSGKSKSIVSVMAGDYSKKKTQVLNILKKVASGEIDYCIDCNIMPNGEYKSFYESGKLHFHGNYIDGKKDGEWIEYNENGTIKEKVYH